MLLPSLVLLTGLALLVWGSDRFVHGAAVTARNLGVSPMIIGLTVIGVGTSAPEILVSAVASANGNPGLAIGNALGSNITNVGLVAGATALVRPLVVRSATLRREFPLMFAVMALATWMLHDGELGRGEGALLLGGTVVVIGALVWAARRARAPDPLVEELAIEMEPAESTARALLWSGAGLVVLLLGSRAIVWGAVDIARSLGVSDLVIGLTVVAVGTSLPELGASIAGVLKGESDIAIGNVLGSNMFNLLPVLAMPGLLAPGEVEREAVVRDLPVMLASSLALFAIAYGRRGRSGIGRVAGGGLLLGFAAYQVLLYFSST